MGDLGKKSTLGEKNGSWLYYTSRRMISRAKWVDLAIRGVATSWLNLMNSNAVGDVYSKNSAAQPLSVVLVFNVKHAGRAAEPYRSQDFV